MNLYEVNKDKITCTQLRPKNLKEPLQNLKDLKELQEYKVE